MKKILWIATIALVMTGAVIQAETVVYQSDFTGTSTDLADYGLAQALNAGAWAMNTTDDRVQFTGNHGNGRSTVYTSGDGWQSAGGFTVEATFKWAADGTRFSMGLVDASWGVRNLDWIDNTYCIGVGLAVDGTVAATAPGQGLTRVWNGDATAWTKLSAGQGALVVGTVYDFSMTVTSEGWSYSINGAVASTGVFAPGDFDATKSYRFVAHAQSNLMNDSYLSNITVTTLDPPAPDEAFLDASGALAIELNRPATTATGSVELVYGTVSTNLEITSIAVSDESHGAGSFNVLSTSPDTLVSTYAGISTLEVEFDNSLAGLTVNGSSATGLVTVTWTETGTGLTNNTVVPVSAIYRTGIWEMDMTADPVGDDWADRNNPSNYTVTNGVMTMNNRTLLDSIPYNALKGITQVDLQWRSITDVVHDWGSFLWLNIDGDLPDKYSVIFQSHLVGDSQTVKVVNGAGAEHTGFSTNMLTLSATLDAINETADYIVTDGEYSVTNTISLVANLGAANYAITLGTLGPSAEVAYLRVEANWETGPIGSISLGGVNEDGDIVFSWDTTYGQSYNVETNANLVFPNWGVYETFVGDGSPVSFTNTPALDQLFYKVTSD